MYWFCDEKLLCIRMRGNHVDCRTARTNVCRFRLEGFYAAISQGSYRCQAFQIYLSASQHMPLQPAQQELECWP